MIVYLKNALKIRWEPFDSTNFPRLEQLDEIPIELSACDINERHKKLLELASL